VSADTTEFVFRIEQGEREPLTIPVLNAFGTASPIPGWTVDAKIKTRPGGAVLYTWPADLAQVTGDGSFIEIRTPASVSAAWAFTSGWYRVKVTDPDSDPDDPTVYRILQGQLVVDPD